MQPTPADDSLVVIAEQLRASMDMTERLADSIDRTGKRVTWLSIAALCVGIGALGLGTAVFLMSLP